MSLSSNCILLRTAKFQPSAVAAAVANKHPLAHLTVVQLPDSECMPLGIIICGTYDIGVLLPLTVM
jgi:hypothetical protein